MNKQKSDEGFWAKIKLVLDKSNSLLDDHSCTIHICPEGPVTPEIFDNIQNKPFKAPR